jgi:hypothetical protein
MRSSHGGCTPRVVRGTYSTSSWSYHPTCPRSGVRQVREITVKEGAGGEADRRIGIQGRTSLQAGSGRTCSTHREEEASVACQGSREPAPPNQRISQVEGAVQPRSCKVHGDGGGEGQRFSHKVMLMRWRATCRERQRLRAPDPAITDILS